MSETITLLAVGDVGPAREVEPERLFELAAPTIRSADVAFCQLEPPYSHRGAPGVSRGTPRRCHPSAITSLKHAGFQVVSFASNHSLDWGTEAFLDTLELLKGQGHLVIGAGTNLEEARRPAVVEVKGTKIGFLGYCSIVMARLSGYAADVAKPGVVPLRAWTHYEPAIDFFDYTPGMPPRTITIAYPEDMEAMRQDIRRLRDQVDVLVVSQHAGLPQIRAVVAMYQKEIARAAIDVGADVVLQHHAHLLRGVEIYKGKPIFYGLSDFGYEAGITTKGTALAQESRESRQWAEFYESYRNQGEWAGRFFGPADRHSSIASKIHIQDGAVKRVGFLPVLLNDQMQATVLQRSDPRAQQVFDYMRAITSEAGLNGRYEWDGDEVVVTQP